ncbi:TetR/AcrR family transcriptional regulator [Pseudomaricurvus alkylphenolicus]|uniref:TetR/AcrR family transcriptional regulator n=1 Tax=Pseudomaricurvus alkylphenolicus TaxID=1306991 RepID=UPI00141E8DEF|nr:TetR/AcrR family transcriptional regulator [Pseudomaricurvus alkylphenolicus]NIB43700.1 TetR/AcrR family transcriptional regulator [Pseudomaricurvus alkylphenolicus]
MTDQTLSNKKTYHHGDLRKTLLDEAAKMICEEGEDALSMRKLAARAGVSRTAPYHHFADKQTLLCAIAEEGFRLFSEMMRRSSIPEEGPVSCEGLQHYVNNYVGFAVEHHQYYDLMFGGRLWRDQGLTDSLKRVAHGSFRGYVERIRSLQEKGLVAREMDALRFSQVSWSTMHGISRLMIDGIYVDSAAIKPICDNAGAMFWAELTGGR